MARAPATLNTSALLRHVDAHEHMHTLWLLKYKKSLYERGYVFISRISHSLHSFPPQLSPTGLLLLLTQDLSDPAKEGWKHIWPQNSPNTFYLEFIKQRVKGTCCPHPKTWSNRKRMSTGVVCQLLKLREKLVFLLWGEDADCLT